MAHTKRIGWILIGVGALVAALFWGLRAQRAREDAPAAPEARAGTTRGADVDLAAGAATNEAARNPAPVPSAPKEPAPPKPIQDARASAPAAFERVGRELIDALQAHQRDPFELDLSPVRRAVRESGVTSEELLKLLDDPATAPAARPALLAAFAFVELVPEPASDRILAIVQQNYAALDGDLGQPAVRAGWASVYGGLIALQMNCETRHVAAIARDCLASTSKGDGTPDERGMAACFALGGFEVALAPDALDPVRRVTTEPTRPFLSSAAWQALARAAEPGDARSMLAAAEKGSGFARIGLEALRDESMSASLQQVIARSSSDALKYSDHMARSAMRGLLSIGSAESLEAFVALALTSKALTGPEHALTAPSPPQSAGALLELTARTRQSAPQLTSAVERSLSGLQARIRRANLTLEARVLCAESVRRALPALEDARDLRTALVILAGVSDRSERAELAAFLPKLAAADRAAVEGAWSQAHGERLDAAR